MPLYEVACEVVNCPEHGKVFEVYLPHFESPNPGCKHCEQFTQRQFSRFNSPFNGAISARYLDKTKEGGNATDGGHWAWKKKTLSGRPEPVYIETFQQQKDYAREEGLCLPTDSNAGFISSDGKSITSASESEAREFVQQTNRDSALHAKIAAEQS